MERVIITSEEVARVQPSAPVSAAPPTAPAPPPQPAGLHWTRFLLTPLVVVLPVLALTSLAFRIALRTQPAGLRYRWTAYLSSLLIISGLLSTVIFLVLLLAHPAEVPVSTGIAELDQRTHFPALPTKTPMTAIEVGQTMRPLVMIASPATRRWFQPQSEPSDVLGAAVLLHADAAGYLFATARHVVDGDEMLRMRHDAAGVMLSTARSGWARATVIARYRAADAALLWLPRRIGSGDFCQPLAPAAGFTPGEPVFVIGHPEGLTFTLSNGMVSRLPNDNEIQLTAPISPGNSGGPVYDAQGRLLAVVVSTIDHRVDPNAQNLNFAVRADRFNHASDWTFTPGGQARFEQYRKECGLQP